MNRKILDAFSKSSRAALDHTCGTPDSATEFYNRIADVRIALKVGLEVMERNMADRRSRDRLADVQALVIGCQSVIGVCTALECFMSTVELLHPELLKANVTKDPKPPEINGGTNRIRKLDLDQ